MSYLVTQKFISKNRSHKILIPQGITLHETASPNATAEAEYNYFNNGAGGRSASAHAFIDYDIYLGVNRLGTQEVQQIENS